MIVADCPLHSCFRWWLCCCCCWFCSIFFEDNDTEVIHVLYWTEKLQWYNISRENLPLRIFMCFTSNSIRRITINDIVFSACLYQIKSKEVLVSNHTYVPAQIYQAQYQHLPQLPISLAYLSFTVINFFQSFSLHTCGAILAVSLSDRWPLFPQCL